MKITYRTKHISCTLHTCVLLEPYSEYGGGHLSKTQTPSNQQKKNKTVYGFTRRRIPLGFSGSEFHNSEIRVSLKQHTLRDPARKTKGV